MRYRYEGTIDWMNAFIGLGCSAAFAFFPGLGKKPKLEINNEGIFLKNYCSYWNGKKEFKWNSIEAVKLGTNRIELTKNIGSTEKIKLPLHTKGQVNSLKTYLQEVAKHKDISYQKQL